MPTITLYSKPNCPLCDHTRHYLQTVIAEQRDPSAWQIEEISILDDQDLFAVYREVIPVVMIEGGPPLKAPESLDIARLRAAFKEAQVPAAPVPAPAPEQAPPPVPNPYAYPYYAAPPKGIMGTFDRLGNRISNHWVAGANTLMGLFAGLPWLAPIFAALGWWFLADPIYTVYMFFCHQLPERAGFIFGYQVAYCWRNTAIYTTIFVFGVLYGLARRGGPNGRLAWMLRPMSLWVFVLLLLPMGADGMSHLLGLRESNAWFDSLTGGAFGTFSLGDAVGTLNWWLRIITGTLFGFAVVRLIFPWVGIAFEQSRRVVWFPPASPRPLSGARPAATA